MLRDIQVRVPNNAAANAFDASPTGFGVYYLDAGTHRFFDMSSTSNTQIPSGVTLQSPTTQGYLLFDKTYPNTLAPSTFQWRIGEVFEKDACGADFTYWAFNANPFSSSFCLNGDDGHHTSGTFFPIAGNIRSTPAGQVGYIYTDPGELIGSSSRDEGFATVFAFQWDWVDANPPLCSSPKYNDAPIQLDVQYLGTWADTDYDGALAFCTPGFAGDEELRVKVRTKDNLSAYAPWQAPIKQLQPEPGWNVLGTPVTILTKTYPPGTVNMEDFTIDFDAWEEDGCGDDDNFNTGCVNNDEDRVLTNKTINWRESPPNVWNPVDIDRKSVV